MDEDHLNIFLEYVPGGSVTSLLRNYGAFEEPLVRNWVRQILTGLNYLHERDIIHRDIKGANMLVDNKGGIKISDFGISKKVEDSKTFSDAIRAQTKLTRYSTRSPSWQSCTQAVVTRVRVLDGAGSGEADCLHQEGRHLEYWMLSCGDVDGRASVGTVDPDAGHL